MNASFPKDSALSQGFVDDKRDPLIHLNLTDSTELWLIQWPVNQNPDFNGLHASLSLKSDGNLATLEDSSGTSYDLVSSTLREPQPIVIMPSSSDAKIVGKISRRVQLIHFHEPGEVLSQVRRSSTALSALSSRRSPKPTRTIRQIDSPTNVGSKNKRLTGKSGSGGNVPEEMKEQSPSSNKSKRHKSTS